MRAPVLLIILFILICFGAGGTQGQTSRRIPDDEMATLGEIAQQLGKTDWNLSLNVCDENGNWHTPVKDGVYNSTVNCTCLVDGCHISAIYLKGQDLPGVLPKSIANLSYLKIIDLNRNFLSGSIPLEWTSTKLKFLGLTVNRLSGKIPKYLGRITSLTNFRLSSNSFTGKLPSFQSWKQLRILELEASGFEGPIPRDISLLHNLIELMLRSCNISGSIPGYLGNFPALTELDLTYNRLEGNITNLEAAGKLQWIYLTRNFLTGPIENWITSRPATYQTDLSYNNFSKVVDDATTCNIDTLNLFRSFSNGKDSDFAKCLKDAPCAEN